MQSSFSPGETHRVFLLSHTNSWESVMEEIVASLSNKMDKFSRRKGVTKTKDNDGLLALFLYILHLSTMLIMRTKFNIDLVCRFISNNLFLFF